MPNVAGSSIHKRRVGLVVWSENRRAHKAVAFVHGLVRFGIVMPLLGHSAFRGMENEIKDLLETALVAEVVILAALLEDRDKASRNHQTGSYEANAVALIRTRRVAVLRALQTL